MKILAAYSFEKDISNIKEQEELLALIDSRADRWLKKKGAQNPKTDHGTFRSLTKNGNGHYSKRSISVSDKTLYQIETTENSRGGQLFTTLLCTVATPNSLKVYCLLSVTNTSTVIAPAKTDPKCPGIVREILKISPDWKIGDTFASDGKAHRIEGAEQGIEIANFITSENRNTPVVLVSEYDGQPIWRNIAANISYDLIGIGHVYVIDEEASFAITDELGRSNSCSNGAIRLYWPTSKNNTILGYKWSASKLVSDERNGDDGQFFRALIRHKVLEVAALTTVPHSAIWEIQSEAIRDKIKKLENEASTQEFYYEAALKYEKQIKELTAEKVTLQSLLNSEKIRADTAESNLAAVTIQLAKPSSPTTSDNNLSASNTNEEGADEDVIRPPQPGDIWYLKKTHSKDTYDVLVPIDDCQHSAWQSANKADKAKKGIERLAHTRRWRQVHHCGTCTGGGVWRVKW